MILYQRLFNDRYSVTIPANKDSVKVRLVPHFDWADEGVLFNSITTSSKTPKDDVGEYANLKITGVTNSGKLVDSKWDALKNAVKEAKVEIKDGAILELYMDYDGNGSWDAESSAKDTPYLIDWNVDDDNKNGIYDYKEGVGSYSYSGYGGVKNENDLKKYKLYAWVETPGNSTFNVYQQLPASTIRLWKDSVKKDQLLSSVANQQRYQAGTITSGNKTVSVDFWMERIALNEISLSASTECLKNSSRQSQYDGYESTVMTYFDVAIDSDNNGVIEHSDLENFLEDHEYGLGKMVDEYGFYDESRQKLTLVHITLPSFVLQNKSKYAIRIENIEGIDIKGVDKNNNDIVLTPNNLFSLENFSSSYFMGNTLFLYVDPIGIAASASNTYKDSIDLSRPTKWLDIKLLKNNSDITKSNWSEIAKDSVGYIIVREQNFYWKLQHDVALQYAMAASEIYGRNDAKNYCLKLLGEEELIELGITHTQLLNQLTGKTSSGFNAGIYRNYINQEYILAFQGSDAPNGLTDFEELADWIANFSTAANIRSAQYDTAINIAMYIAQKHSEILRENRPENELLKNKIQIVGHSLGGGLASMASIASGLPAMTFNAAGISSEFVNNTINAIQESLATNSDYYKTLENSRSNFTNPTAIQKIKRVANTWDILSQAALHLDIVPSAIGEKYRISLSSQYDIRMAAFHRMSILLPIPYTIEQRLITNLISLNEKINTKINFNDKIKLIRTALTLNEIKKYARYPGEIHRMQQVIFGLVNNPNVVDNVFGYNPIPKESWE